MRPRVRAESEFGDVVRLAVRDPMRELDLEARIPGEGRDFRRQWYGRIDDLHGVGGTAADLTTTSLDTPGGPC